MKASAKSQTSRIGWIVVGGLVLVIVVACLYYFFVASVPGKSNELYSTPSMTRAELFWRKTRIISTYWKLGLGKDYAPKGEEIFGEKRIYAWDKGRTFSSSRSYVRQADVNKTVAELRPKIEAAGFHFIGEPYPNAVDVQLHFKSRDGVYLRLTVSSKPRDDAIQAQAGKDIDFSKIGYREAPSNVLIKVNLDDNNE